MEQLYYKFHIFCVSGSSRTKSKVYFPFLIRPLPIVSISLSLSGFISDTETDIRLELASHRYRTVAGAESTMSS